MTEPTGRNTESEDNLLKIIVENRTPDPDENLKKSWAVCQPDFQEGWEKEIMLWDFQESYGYI